jgi:hypothetical protein
MSKTNGSVTLINLFEIPPDADEAFIGGWEKASSMPYRPHPALYEVIRR